MQVSQTFLRCSKQTDVEIFQDSVSVYNECPANTPIQSFLNEELKENWQDQQEQAIQTMRVCSHDYKVSQDKYSQRLVTVRHLHRPMLIKLLWERAQVRKTRIVKGNYFTAQRWLADVLSATKAIHLFIHGVVHISTWFKIKCVSLLLLCMLAVHLLLGNL